MADHKSNKHLTKDDQLALHFNSKSSGDNVIKFDSNVKVKSSNKDRQERESIINKILCDAKELGW